MGIAEPDEVDWEYGNLWQLSEAARADVDLKRAQTDEINIRNGTINEVIAAKRMHEDGTYPALDEKAIKEIEAMAEQREEDFENQLDQPVDPNADPNVVPIKGRRREAV